MSLKFWSNTDRHNALKIYKAHYHGLKYKVLSNSLKADIERQNYSFTPLFHYFDLLIECCRCKKKFTFSAEEQKYWYETLHFFFEAVPHNCQTCRKELRLKKTYYDQLRALSKDKISVSQNRTKIKSLIGESLNIEDLQITQKRLDKIFHILNLAQFKDKQELKDKLRSKLIRKQ